MDSNSSTVCSAVLFSILYQYLFFLRRDIVLSMGILWYRLCCNLKRVCGVFAFLLLKVQCTYFPSFGSPFQSLLTLGESVSWWWVEISTVAQSTKIFSLHCLLTPQNATLWIMGHMSDSFQICSTLPELLCCPRIALEIESFTLGSLFPWPPSFRYCFARLYLFLCLNVVAI